MAWRKRRRNTMGRKLYVIRHGQTQWNVENRVCGRADVELDETGKAQARAAAGQLVGKGITRVIVSPLTRTQQTAQLLLEGSGLNVPVELDARIMEHDFGANDGIDRRDPDFLKCRREVPLRQPGGESVFQVVHRVYSLIDEVKADGGQGNVLFVCHGAVSRVIRSYFVDMTNEEFFGYLAGNCELVGYDL